eukprot:1195489-Prorocentrum_minimum.AAC.19
MFVKDVTRASGSRRPSSSLWWPLRDSLTATNSLGRRGSSGGPRQESSGRECSGDGSSDGVRGGWQGRRGSSGGPRQESSGRECSGDALRGGRRGESGRRGSSGGRRGESGRKGSSGGYQGDIGRGNLRWGGSGGLATRISPLGFLSEESQERGVSGGGRLGTVARGRRSLQEGVAVAVVCTIVYTFHLLGLRQALTVAS